MLMTIIVLSLVIFNASHQPQPHLNIPIFKYLKYLQVSNFKSLALCYAAFLHEAVFIPAQSV